MEELVAEYNKKKRSSSEVVLQKELNKITNDTIQHCKRLNKKRKDEIERGVHEYANYIVSMIYANINN